MLSIESILNDYAAALEICLLPTQTKNFKSNKRKKGQFEFIPLGLERFITQMNVIRGLTKVKEFIDVGCGIGTKLALAKASLKYCGQTKFNGVEITKNYVCAARKLLSRLEIPGEIIEADALTIDYHRYDVIYFYSPLINDDMEKALEQRIVTTAREGSFILANRRCGKEDIWNDRVQLIWSDSSQQCSTEIFKKVK